MGWLAVTLQAEVNLARLQSGLGFAPSHWQANAASAMIIKSLAEVLEQKGNFPRPSAGDTKLSSSLYPVNDPQIDSPSSISFVQDFSTASETLP